MRKDARFEASMLVGGIVFGAGLVLACQMFWRTAPQPEVTVEQYPSAEQVEFIRESLIPIIRLSSGWTQESMELADKCLVSREIEMSDEEEQGMLLRECELQYPGLADELEALTERYRQQLRVVTTEQADKLVDEDYIEKLEEAMYPERIANFVRALGAVEYTACRMHAKKPKECVAVLKEVRDCAMSWEQAVIFAESDPEDYGLVCASPFIEQIRLAKRN